MIILSKEQKKIRAKWKKLGIKIDRELRDILHGYIMSDGHVRSAGVCTVEHAVGQRAFVEWLYVKMQPIRTNTPIRHTTRIDKRSGKATHSKCFQTRSLCKGFREIWYKPVTSRGKKRFRKCLPKNIQCFFNATFISVWFAGDGTRTVGHRGAKFEVTCFTPEERLFLKQLFDLKFAIKAKICRAGVSQTGTTQWTLSIPAGEYEKFRTLITQMDLIPKIFPHKLCKKLKK